MTQPTQTGGRLPDADIDEANRRLDRVFALLGLVAEGHLVCPACGTAKAKKVAFKSSRAGIPYWKCFRCGAHGSAVKLYQERAGVNFPSAVNAILGRTEVEAITASAMPSVVIAQSFVAVADEEIYDAALTLGSLKAAQSYWARWHISPDAVAEVGSKLITNTSGLERYLTSRFGMERLLASGLVVQTAKGNDYFLLNDDYPVIEPMRRADGHVRAMQFRPSETHRIKVEAHKSWKREHGEGEEGGPKYVPPFLSPRGAQPETLIGYGLPQIAKLEAGTTIYVVEGCKDLLAARSMGIEAFAIPGTGVMPPDESLEVLARLRVVVVLDGDEAGAKGRTELVSYLKEKGVNADPFAHVREGMDITDILVERHANEGCGCETCTSWRSSHQSNS